MEEPEYNFSAVWNFSVKISLKLKGPHWKDHPIILDLYIF